MNDKKELKERIKNIFIHTEPYARKVLPFLKEEYFADRLERLIFREINNFYDKFNAAPTNETLAIELKQKRYQ